jgi:hypothetical protein
MPELLENQTGDLAKSGVKMKIHKISAHMETLCIFLCAKERNCVSPTRLNFQTASRRLVIPWLSGFHPLSHLLYIDKYLFWFLNMKDVYLPSEIWDITWSLHPPPIIWKSLRPIKRRHSTFEHTDQYLNQDVTPEEKKSWKQTKTFCATTNSEFDKDPYWTNIPSCIVAVWGHVRSRLVVPIFTTHKRNWDLGSLRFAAYTGQTMESAEAHAGMDKCIVVLSTKPPTSKTHRENETMERIQKGEYEPWRMAAVW